MYLVKLKTHKEKQAVAIDADKLKIKETKDTARFSKGRETVAWYDLEKVEWFVKLTPGREQKEIDLLMK